MASTPNVVGLTRSSRAWRERWLSLRDVLGGALLLAAWLALWTVTWAAVAGPLSPVRDVAGRSAAVRVERGT